MHCGRSNTSEETDFLLCVVALIRISTFTFHGLMNFCTHASLQLLVVVLQVPTLKVSLILPSLVKSKSRLETFAVFQDLPWKNETKNKAHFQYIFCKSGNYDHVNHRSSTRTDSGSWIQLFQHIHGCSVY